MSRFFDQIIATVDFKMPWILPSLETIEQTFPFPLRLLVAASLTILLVWSRRRNSFQLSSKAP